VGTNPLKCEGVEFTILALLCQILYLESNSLQVEMGGLNNFGHRAMLSGYCAKSSSVCLSVKKEVLQKFGSLGPCNIDGGLV